MRAEGSCRRNSFFASKANSFKTMLMKREVDAIIVQKDFYFYDYSILLELCNVGEIDCTGTSALEENMGKEIFSVVSLSYRQHRK